MADQHNNSGNISSADSETSNLPSRLPTKAEWEAETQRRKDNERLRRELKREEKRRFGAVAIAADLQWEWADQADHEHMQLVAHGINPTAYMRRFADRLLLPLYCYGELVNLLYVRPDGIMTLMPGGRRNGTYILFGQVAEDQPLYLTEKWITGAKFHQESGAAVACSLFPGNLLAAGRSVEQQYPYQKLILVQEATCSKEVRAEFLHARAELARSTVLDLGEVDHG